MAWPASSTAARSPRRAPGLVDLIAIFAGHRGGIRAPPIAGLLSRSLRPDPPVPGGSYVTVSGPAAGLAPALLVAMTSSAGNLATGYPLLLGVICLTGAVQVVLSKMKAARFCTFFLPSWSKACSPRSA